MANKWGRSGGQGKGWENRLEREGEGRRQPGSGNGMFHKADLKSRVFLTEAKETGADSFSLTKEMLKKIHAQAINELKVPVLMLNLDGIEVAILRRSDWTEFKRDLELND